jgi:hypothetical protein
VSDSSSPNAAPPDGIVARPPGQLHDLPLEARWEVTRRNPYYLVFWEQARAFRRAQLGNNPVEFYLRYAANLILAEIGATGVPVSPATSAEELIDGDADLSFLTGTVQPVTFPGVAAMIINGLPLAALEALGEILITAGRGEYPEPEAAPPNIQKMLAGAELSRLLSLALDSFPVLPLFYIHLGASKKSIVRDTEEQVRRWKKRRDLGSPKIHSGKINSYLKVWDLREDWTGAGYERGREHTFVAVARTLRSGSTSKVASCYRAAFKLITGHDFSPELWLRLFVPLKFSELLGDPVIVLSDPIRHGSVRAAPVPCPSP